MGTRSIILVTGPGNFSDNSTVRLYKHWDGYPSEVLNLLADALTDADKVLTNTDHETKLRTGLIVGKIIGADTGEYGPGARVDCDYDKNESSKSAEYDEPLKPSHFGNQGDLEWIYVVDAFHKNVGVYAATTDSPGEINLNKVTNTEAYVNRYQGATRDKVEAEMSKAIEKLGAVGFTVNKVTK